MFQCPACHHTLTLRQTIVMCASHEPENNAGIDEIVSRMVKHKIRLTPRVEHPLHDFFRPRTFAKNFVVGLGVELFGCGL